MTKKNKDIVRQNKIYVYLALATCGVLLVPLVMTRVSPGWDWTLFDFMVVGALLFGMSSMFIVVARLIPKKFRAITAIAFVLTTAAIWVHLAVGIVDTWPFAGS